MGRSDILTAKLRDLEDSKAQLTANMEVSISPIISGAADKWREVVENLESLHKYAKPEEVEEAREALKGIIGEVTVVEEGERILAYPKLGHTFVYKSGAGRGNRTPTSFRKLDFESSASTSSATPACLGGRVYKLRSPGRTAHSIGALTFRRQRQIYGFYATFLDDSASKIPRHEQIC